VRQGVLPQGVNEPEGERQAHLAPGPKMGHESGEPMFRGVGERCRTGGRRGLYAVVAAALVEPSAPTPAKPGESPQLTPWRR
jgi:hypothetical protein